MAICTSLPVSPAYNAFDFSTIWNYNLPQQVNDKNVNITLRNVWVPSNIPVPDETQASTIITAEKLMVTGSATETTGKITITYSPGAEEDLRMETLGVWLPRGFSYTVGSSNLEADHHGCLLLRASRPIPSRQPGDSLDIQLSPFH